MKNKILSISLSLGLFLGVNAAFIPKAFAASCTDQGLGKASNGYDFPAAGNKQIWLRMAGTKATSKRINVEIKDANGATTCLLATNDTPTTNWVWKRAGGASGTFAATQSNTVTLYGLDDGVRVEKVVAFDAARSCTPSNVFPGTLGDECLDPSTPPPPPTPTPDTTAPTGPTTLTASPVNASQVNLTWGGTISDNVGVTGFDILRDGTKITTVSAATRSYSNAGLKAATVYTYKVVAKDAAGNTSSGVTVSATTQPAPTTPPSPTTQVPATPTGLTRNLVFDFGRFGYYMELKWAASIGATSYTVTRNDAPLGTTTTTSIRDNNPVVGNYYTYKVSAQNTAGTSAPAVTTTVGRCFLIWCWAE